MGAFARVESLKPSGEQQDNQNDDDQACHSAGAIAPLAAVGPGGKGADESEDQNDQQDGAHGLLLKMMMQLARHQAGSGLQLALEVMK
jgi:hypothetical protein